MEPRIRWLKRERRALGVFTGIETYLAIKIILMEILTQYWISLDSKTKDLFFARNGFGNRIFFVWIREEYQWFTIFIVYGSVCFVLAAALFFCYFSNYKEPIASGWSLVIFSLGIMLPILIWLLYLMFGDARYEIMAIWQWWLYLGIVLSHVFLYRDLHRYTKAIRAQKREDALAENGV